MFESLEKVLNSCNLIMDGMHIGTFSWCSSHVRLLINFGLNPIKSKSVNRHYKEIMTE